MKLSIVIPFYGEMENGEYFLSRCINSIKKQTFTDYEIIMTDKGNTSHNTNRGIKRAKGEYIKILHQDDYFFDENSLQKIVDKMPFDWLVTGCTHDDMTDKYFNNHIPEYNEMTDNGVNTIGAPSVLTMRNDKPLLFDEHLVWVLDTDYYRRLFTRYGMPEVIEEPLVVIGIGGHQATNNITEDIKIKEEKYVRTTL